MTRFSIVAGLTLLGWGFIGGCAFLLDTFGLDDLWVRFLIALNFACGCFAWAAAFCYREERTPRNFRTGDRPKAH